MSSSALWWLFFNVLSVTISAFFSMMEMACVSFNRVRLHYYVSQGNKRAIWLNYLLKHPFRLFGTTLIGVNVTLVTGSESAREFYAAIGVNPDLAPLTQVAFVVIFGELAPMFAARHYAEHAAMLGVPIIYGTARLLAPVLWLVGLLTRFMNFIFGSKTDKSEIFLSQEELQHILEEHREEGAASTPAENFNRVTSNIFQLRNKRAANIVLPLPDFPRLPSNATVFQMRQMLKRTDAPFILIFYRDIRNIVGISFPRDILRVPDSKRVRDYCRPPWFVTEQTEIPQILNQFRKNNQSVSVIIDREGNATGIITLDHILGQIFEEIAAVTEPAKQMIERTFSGEILVKEFNQEFNVTLSKDEEQTLSELFVSMLEHHPEEGDSITIDSFELIAKEVSLLEVKSITIRSVF